MESSHNEKKNFLSVGQRGRSTPYHQHGEGVVILGSVFRRLCKAVNEIDAKLGFQHTSSLGYLTACPTNLGTGMRASVHIKIPNAYNHPDFKAICDKYQIQARGIHGEHSESTGEDAGVYDISNKRRLGLSEVQCVQDMYDGVMKLLEMEKKAA